MTQYMLSTFHEAGVQERDFGPYASQDDMQAAFDAVSAFNARLQESGAWVFAGGLAAPSTATVVDGTGAEAVTTDGPFAESREYLGGFWVISADDLDAALRIAAEASQACGQRLEVRPLMGE